LPVTCHVGGFFRLPPSIKLPWYNWNIVKCGVKHHKPKPNILKCYNTIYEYIPLYILLYSRNPVLWKHFQRMYYQSATNIHFFQNSKQTFHTSQLNCPDMSLHIEAWNKHCDVESLKNSVLDIIESLKLFKSMEIAMKYFIFRFFHDFHLWI
jgi:hypothetical protein